MKILIDCFGCDRPKEFISGIPAAINGAEDVTLLLSGEREYIEECLRDYDFDRSRIEFLEAKDVITNSDSPVNAIRRKPDSSLVRGIRALRDCEDIPIMITAGNTGAVLASAVLILGRIDREIQPTLVTFIPNAAGGVTCLADCGANVDCRPAHLVKFAEYANEYMSKVMDVKNPKIGLLSVGTEDSKGNAQTKETFALLRESSLNFIGNMEAKSALTGEYDIIVADGYAGNVLLKSIEGTAKYTAKTFSELISRLAPAGTDLSFVKSAASELMKQLDFNSMGGAVILGAKKPIIKAHGSANSSTLKNTLKQAIKIVAAEAKS